MVLITVHGAGLREQRTSYCHAILCHLSGTGSFMHGMYWPGRAESLPLLHKFVMPLWFSWSAAKVVYSTFFSLPGRCEAFLIGHPPLCCCLYRNKQRTKEVLEELLHTHVHIIIRFVPGRIESSDSMADGAGHFISEGVCENNINDSTWASGSFLDIYVPRNLSICVICRLCCTIC